jgi:hypothetical protein
MDIIRKIHGQNYIFHSNFDLARALTLIGESKNTQEFENLLEDFNIEFEYEL